MLTERQIQLLSAIIKEYLESAEPVGSLEIVNKYNMNCSAATVRNEMAKLLEGGFLDMPHTSSGRIPTHLAYKYFLTELVEEQEIPVLQEVAMKQRLWPVRFEFEKLLRQAAIAVSDITKELALITTNDGFVTQAGSVNLLDSREFWDINVTKATLLFVDKFELLEQVFSLNSSSREGNVSYLLGPEIGFENMDNCGIVFSNYDTGKKSGHVAVFGPSRMNYETVIPAVRYTKNLIQELGEGW